MKKTDVKSHLTKSQLDALAKALGAEQKRLQSRLGLEANPNQADWNPDRGELAAAASRRDRRMALNELDEEKLDLVTSALARLDEGTYGICLECAQPIDPDRLEIVPYAALCAPCQAKED